MTKRRLDDNNFANVLRQKAKEDPILIQQEAQKTFMRLMTEKPKKERDPYEYFNTPEFQPIIHCRRCKVEASKDFKCTFCEDIVCPKCLQDCDACQLKFCSTCSVFDYSMSNDRIFCISCKQN